MQLTLILRWRVFYPPPLLLQDIENKLFMKEVVEVAGTEELSDDT